MPENTTNEQYRNIRVTLHYFTPEFCAALLERNTRNRRENPRTQRALQQELKEARFYLSDSAIVVGPDGTLINGQNRCRASVETGIGFWAFYATGVPFASQLIMDTGGKRTFAQHLQIAYGEANAETKATVTTALWKYENGNYNYRGNYFQRPEPRVTDLDVLWIEAGEEIAASIRATETTRRQTVYTKTALALVWILTQRIDQTDSDYFFERLGSGADLPDDSPILAARRWIATVSRHATRPDTRQQAAILIKAWNKYREGETVKLLVYRPGGANPEQYPQPR